MDEEKNVIPPESNKEKTIDILVNPKRKEETAAPEHAPSPKPAPKPVKNREAEEKSAPVRKNPSPNSSDRTRAIPSAAPKARVAPGRSAQETRVGTAVPTGQKNTASANAEKKTPSSTPTGEKFSAKENAEEKKEARATFHTTLITVLVYVGVVVGISAILSYFGIRWANDVFALVKEEVVATVEIPEAAQLKEVADLLEENGIIEYAGVFEAYIKFKNGDDLAFKAGTYELKSTLNYDQIVSLIKDRKTRQIVTITIPEGYTIDEIIDLFVSKGIGTREGFVNAINTYGYDYRFMEELAASSLSTERIYRLEGYLFPDTYEFYTDSSEIAIVDKMLTAFEAHFEEAYYDRLDEMGMTLDEVITLASIIQMEGKFTSDFYKISGVFHNRLESKDLKKLQSDATIQYCLPERKEELTDADLGVESPYNSYTNEGLPPSAIANPGWEAIQAALYPESSDYLFFVSDTDGTTVFAKTMQEHGTNVALRKRALENGTTIAIEREKMK